MLVALALNAPLSLLTHSLRLPPSVEALHGSLWRGRATLAGGYRVRWDSAVSFAGLPHLASDIVLEGSDTRVTGVLRAGPRGAILTQAAGRAGPGLAGLVEGAWLCDMTARVSDVRLAWRWRSASAGGEITTPAGQCTKDGRTQAIPPLVLTLGEAGRDARMTLAEPGDPPMAQVVIRRARELDITIEPRAADVFPVLPRSGPIALQLPF